MDEDELYFLYLAEEQGRNLPTRPKTAYSQRGYVASPELNPRVCPVGALACRMAVDHWPYRITVPLDDTRSFLTQPRGPTPSRTLAPVRPPPPCPW